MKCPFRKTIKHRPENGGHTEYEEYSDCYGRECPYYNHIVTNTGITAWSCGRVKEKDR